MRPAGLIVLGFFVLGALGVWTILGQPAVSFSDFSIPPACSFTPAIKFSPTGTPYAVAVCNGLYSLLAGGTIAGLIASVFTAGMGGVPGGTGPGRRKSLIV